MNQLSNLNAKIVKSVFYDSAINPSATTINMTVLNTAVNAFVEQVIINLTSTESTFGSAIELVFLDRGNGYPFPLNGLEPTQLVGVGTNSTYSTGTVTQNSITQNSKTVIIQVNQSIQDSEGCGLFYIQLTKSFGAFNQNFTLSVVYRPEITYNTLLDTRNQLSDCKVFRAVLQTGLASWADPSSTMTDYTNCIAKIPNKRNNIETVTFGFSVSTSNPNFYFGARSPVQRYYIGFGSDCTHGISTVTFSYFNGTTFIGCPATGLYNGALGQGTSVFSYDGIITINPAGLQGWASTFLPQDSHVISNNMNLGLGNTLGSQYLNNDIWLYWLQVNVGLATSATLLVSTIAPLINPQLPISYKRGLI